MSHTVCATFKFKDGKKQDFLDILNRPEGLEVTREGEGCSSISVFESEEDPNLLVIWQKWESKTNHESYLEMRKSTGLFNQVMEMLNEPFEVLHLDSVPV